MKVSIIIPVYNVEKYLSECVNSVLEQTYPEIEVLLIDDGSTDSSSEVCDGFAASDHRIKVIHQLNRGLSGARNVGLKNANGEYVLFVDSDDYLLKKNAIELLVKRAEQTDSDVLNYSYCKLDEKAGTILPYFRRTETMPGFAEKSEQLLFMAKKRLYIASACNKMIRMELIKSGNLFFEEGETSEDIVWCLKLLIYAESLDYLNETLYCYRQRSGSITHSFSEQSCRELTRHIIEGAKLVQGLKDLAYFQYVGYQYATFMMVQTYVERFPEECVNELAPFTWLLKYDSGDIKVVLLRVLTRAFGYRRTCKMIYVFYNSHRKKK